MGGAESKTRQRPLRNHSHVTERPSPPGKPQLVPSDQHSPEPDVVTIRWEPPLYDGGSRITGYLVEHRRTGSPHWVRSSPGLVRTPELTLSGLEPGWRYQFRVSAQNSAGLSEPGDLSDLLTVTLQRTAASAPFFVKELRDTTAIENEKAELSVQVRGTPTPTLAWFKDGVEIFSSRSYRIVTDNEVSTLVIHQAALSDEGEIKCSATNRVGYAVSRAKLTLEAPPSIRLPRQYEEGLLFEKDEVIRLKVSVAGRPVPEVSWMLNGEPVPGGGRYEAVHSERYATLRVGEARRSDRGEYQVRAVNKLGEDIASFLVTVADRPMAPGRAKVVMTLGRSVTLSWTTPEDDGGCKIGNYIVEYYRLGWNMWLKAATCRQLTTTLGDLIEGSEYKFRVKAENPYGVSEPSPESDVVFIPDPKRGLLEPPEHGKTEVDMDVWLEDKKRAVSASPTIDEQYGERKTKKKRGPMVPPHPTITMDLLGLTEKHSMMSEDSMSPPVTPENQSFHPVIPKRRGKSDKATQEKPRPQEKELERRLKDLQEEKELQRKLEERRKVEEFKRFEERKKAEEERMRKAEERRRIDEVKKNENKTKSDSKKQKTPETPQSPQSPRIGGTSFHGSSELMLVLLPHSRATTEERETSKRELFESSMALEGDIAPPMSLSAPELGSGDPLELLPLRSSYSSTELLHERAMARFYQDMAEEEAESTLRRRSSIQRRRSFGSRPRDVPVTVSSLQDIPSSVVALSDNTDSTRPSQSENKPPDPETSTVQPGKKPLLKDLRDDSVDSVLSIEDPNRKPPLVQQSSGEDMEYEDSSFDEYEEDEYDEEEDESIIDEQAEEELGDEMEEEELEEEEELGSYGKRGSLYTSESEEDMRYSYSLQEDTYRPSSLNIKYTEDSLISAYEGRGPLILGTPKVLQPLELPSNTIPYEAVSAAQTSTSDESTLKPILKKTSAEKPSPKNNEPGEKFQSSDKFDDQKPRRLASPEKRFEPNFSATMPKPILKVREPSQERYSPVIPRRGAPVASVESELNLQSSRSNLDEGSDHETSVKKKQVRIEEPDDVVYRQTDKLEELKGKEKELSSEYEARPRSGSLNEDVEATRVLISHYSEIVAEYGRIKRSPRLYLNYEALKAAAEKEEESAPEIPKIVVNEPEPVVAPEPIVDYAVEQTRAVEELTYSKDKVTESKIKEPDPDEYPSLLNNPSRLSESHKNETLQWKKDIKKRSASPRKRSASPRKKRSPSPRKSVVAIAEDIPLMKTEIARTPSPVLPPRLYTPTEKKVHCYFDFFMDFSLFILACWLYLFKDERLSIPVLGLMIYRQASEAFQRQVENFKLKIHNTSKRLMFWKK